MRQLYPVDSALNEEHRKWKEEMDEKAYMAKSNPLALAGALGDDEAGDGQKSQVIESRESKVTRYLTSILTSLSLSTNPKSQTPIRKCHSCTRY